MLEPDRRTFLRLTALATTGIACTSTPTSTPTSTATSTEDAAPASPTPTDDQAALRWRVIDPGGRMPPARREHTLTAASGSLYLFGGRSGGTPRDDLWRFDGNQWSRVGPTGDAPSARFGHNAEHDGDGRIIVFGGQAGGDLFNDAYAFVTDEQRWHRLEPSGPAPGIRYGAGSIADGANLVISHGFNFSGRFDDTRALHSGQVRWRNRTPDGALPVRRCLHRCANVDGEMLLFGGQTTGASYLGDTWMLDFERNRWREVSGRAPSDRNLYALDASGDRAFLFGGFASGGTLNDTWMFRNDRWRELRPGGSKPSARGGIEGAIMGAGNESELYVFGGSDGGGELDDLWALNVGVA